jgi:hypothetical protein
MYGITAEVVSVWRLRLKLTWLFRTFVMEQPDSSVECWRNGALQFRTWSGLSGNVDDGELL